MVRQVHSLSIAISIASVALALAQPARGETVTIGIGTQDTTTNTVTTGIVIRQLRLLEKYLPTDGKYANIKFELEWQNFTSGPPVTNGMMANKLQFGAMGDYPLVVNGFTFEKNPESKSRLIAVAAYSMSGSGNGLVVHKDSPYYEFADLKGKLVSVPFGSAAHGMMLKAMQDRGYPADFFQLVSQSPEVGSTNLQEKKIDAHADFVPFAELLPFRGFARKIFDGVETNLPTWHGVVVRTDFAEKYPEVVVAYMKAIIAANQWLRADPKLAAEKIAEWTGISKEVVYIFLGPSGSEAVITSHEPRGAAAQEVAGHAEPALAHEPDAVGVARVHDLDAHVAVLDDEALALGHGREPRVQGPPHLHRRGIDLEGEPVLLHVPQARDHVSAARRAAPARSTAWRPSSRTPARPKKPWICPS